MAHEAARCAVEREVDEAAAIHTGVVRGAGAAGAHIQVPSRRRAGATGSHHPICRGLDSLATRFYGHPTRTPSTLLPVPPLPLDAIL
jgi:hypothetical protein